MIYDLRFTIGSSDFNRFVLSKSKAIEIATTNRKEFAITVTTRKISMKLGVPGVLAVNLSNEFD